MQLFNENGFHSGSATRLLLFIVAIACFATIATAAARGDDEQAKTIAEVQGRWVRQQNTPEGVTPW